jgi:hypothetical protein
MHVNNLPVRYVGEVFSPNYAKHTRTYLSLAHAREDFADLSFATDSDELVLWHCSPHDSEGEAYSRTSELEVAAYRLSRGPRGGVKVEKL